MPRIDLQVPFADKEQAKRLGARWDAQQRTWYVPEDVELAAFRKWLPESQAPNIRASAWCLLTGARDCWKCKLPTAVFAIVLPPGHEALIVEDDPADDRWERAECPALLSYLSDVPAPVAAQIQALAPQYRVDYSHTTNSFYWMNHCERCQAKLGDFDTMEEPGTFYELGAGFGELQLIGKDLHSISEPFCGRCGGYIEVG